MRVVAGGMHPAWCQAVVRSFASSPSFRRPTAKDAAGQRSSKAAGPQEQVAKDVQEHMAKLRASRTKTFKERGSQDAEKGSGSLGYDGPFQEDWRERQKVPYKYDLLHMDSQPVKEKEKDAKPIRLPEKPYTSFTGLRFPTFSTAEHFDELSPQGLDRVAERSFPIKVPGYRRLDPYLREYIHFLHKLDPARFTISRIAERYRLRPKIVAKVVQEWGTNLYLTRSGLTKLREKQVTREEEIMRRKEEMYGKWVGFDQIGDQDDDENSDDEEMPVGEFKGWRPTHDWVRKQHIQVEMMSAFPMMNLRNPMPKRVDIDLCVDSQPHQKVINWIDPTDKVVF